MNWCSLNVEKPGIINVKQKKKIKSLKGTLTTSPAMIVEEKAIIREIYNDPPKQISKRMQNH